MTTQEAPICQICGKPIQRKLYLWDDDPRLPVHSNQSDCGGLEAFCAFLNRNKNYINRQGPPVLREAAAG